jgi:hypothetical protein
MLAPGKKQDPISKMPRAKSGISSHACNPSYSGSRDGEDRCLRPALAKKFTRLHLNQQLDMVAHAYHPKYMGIEDREHCSSRPARTKSSQDPVSQHKRLGLVACACHYSYCEKHK